MLDGVSGSASMTGHSALGWSTIALARSTSGVLPALEPVSMKCPPQCRRGEKEPHLPDLAKRLTGFVANWPRIAGGRDSSIPAGLYFRDERAVAAITG